MRHSKQMTHPSSLVLRTVDIDLTEWQWLVICKVTYLGDPKSLPVDLSIQSMNWSNRLGNGVSLVPLGHTVLWVHNDRRSLDVLHVTCHYRWGPKLKASSLHLNLELWALLGEIGLGCDQSHLLFIIFNDIDLGRDQSHVLFIIFNGIDIALSWLLHLKILVDNQPSNAIHYFSIKCRSFRCKILYTWHDLVSPKFHTAQLPPPIGAFTTLGHEPRWEAIYEEHSFKTANVVDLDIKEVGQVEFLVFFTFRYAKWSFLIFFMTGIMLTIQSRCLS